MAWRTSTVYAQATPRLRECLLGDRWLGQELHHIGRIEHAWPRGIARHALPPGGLLAVPGVGPPDDERDQVVVPWDALHGASGPAIHFPSPAALAEQLSPSTWPPPATLKYLKDMSHRAGGPVSLYRCEMWGGDVDLEATWLPGWAPGEPDRVLLRLPGGRMATAVGGHLYEETADVLVRLLEYHRLRLNSPYFAPHTRGFPWERYRVCPKEPVPEDIPGLDRPERPRPPVAGSLFRCVELGDLAGVETLLAAGVDANAYASEGPLERAARMGRDDLVARLLAAGANAVPKDRPGALHGAATVACAELLVAAGAPIDPHERFFPPLVTVVGAGHEAVARWLVAQGASVRPQGHAHAVFSAACRAGMGWLVELALAAGVAVDQGEYGDSGRSGLALAAADGREEVVRLLLARGAKLSEETWYAACSGGSLVLVEEHLARGQDVRAEVFGTEAIAAAAREGQGAVVRRLLDAGADPGIVVHGETLLHKAAWAGSAEAVRVLLERSPAGAIEARSNMDWTPLFAAVWRGHREVIAVLLAAGANCEVVDEHGRSLRVEAERRAISLAR